MFHQYTELIFWRKDCLPRELFDDQLVVVIIYQVQVYSTPLRQKDTILTGSINDRPKLVVTRPNITGCGDGEFIIYC